MSAVLAFKETLSHLFHPRRSNNHRPRVLHPEAYIYFTAIIVGFVALINGWQLTPDKFSHILGFSSTITPAEVIRQTNVERDRAGLQPVTINTTLSQAALAKGQDMMSDQYWAHVAPDGKEPWTFMREAGYSYTVAGENLARDFSATPEMVAAWMASPTHRANILNPKYQEIGIAVIDGELLGYETTLVVQMFGTPKEPTTALNPDVGDQAVSVVQAESLDLATDGINQQAVLAGALVPVGKLEVPPLFTPLQLSKAFFLSLIMMLSGTLLYDAFVIGNRDTARMVGKNLAHLVFFSAIAFLVIFFKAGLIG